MAETNLLTSAKTLFAEPQPADGAVYPLNLNQDGRLRVASKQGSFPPTSGVLSAIGSQLAVDVADSSNVVVHVKNASATAMAAGAFSFEGSLDSTDGIDGTWFATQAVRSNVNTVESITGTLAIGANLGLAYAWELSVNAVKWFRIRTTTAVTAGSVATWTVLRGSYATEPIPAIQTHAVTGSVTATPATSLMYSLNTAATTNAALVKTASTGLYEITVFNPSAATIYVKLFNKATVAPIPGTDVPVVTVPVAAGGFANIEFGSVGKRFTLGLGIAVTAAAAPLDATAVAAGIQIHASYI